jgi:membrane-bound inhibitor of C-type lysozyme
MRLLLVTLAALPALAIPALAQNATPAAPATPSPPAVSSSVQIDLGTTGDFDRKTVSYGCKGREQPLVVRYINAAPNFLALVPVEDGTLLFTTVLAASGAKYASGKYIWWSKGPEASLYDLTQGDNTKPILTCSEVSEIP